MKNIVLRQNNITSINVGASIIFNNCKILNNSSNDDSSLNQQLIKLNNKYNSDYKNKIILNIVLSNEETYCLLTKNNIKNNMKFLFDSDNKKNGKLLFITNQDKSDNSNNFLFNKLLNYEEANNGSRKSFIFHLNYYFNNKDNSSNFYSTNRGTTNTSNYDYYKFNIKDYIVRDLSTSFFSDLCYSNLRFIIKSQQSTPNLYIDTKSNDFQQISDISNINSLINHTDISYTIYNNIYAKYTTYYNNTTYDISIVNISNGTVKTLSISFDTFLISTNNYEMMKQTSNKIFFDTTNTIYFSNIKVSTPSKPIIFGEKANNPSTIYLSLGNSITGITQSDIYNHIAFTSQTMEKIIFSENITSNVINNSTLSIEKKYNSLIVNLYKDYLFDIELSANIMFKSITINTIYYNTNKVFPIYFNNFFDLSNLRTYYNNFNNIAFTSISGTNIRPNINFYNTTINPANYTTNSISFDIIDVTKDYLYRTSSSLSTRNLLDPNYYYALTKPAYLDVRFNYNIYFYVDLSFDIFYNSSDPRNNGKINYYAITVACLIYTTPARDFTDVECIYIYHNPDTETDPSFRYPYNNIEIIREPSNNDTLFKAIELLPNSNRGNLNSSIIPEKNGSNLSRKMIQGLIGLNNIPKLLSIKPYDPNILVGRGFINQYQIDNKCIDSQEEIVKNKINAIKHSSAKDSKNLINNQLEKQNFANLVRSNRRNRLSQQCIENLRNGNVNTVEIDYAKVVPYTPRFKIFKTGKGHYL